MDDLRLPAVAARLVAWHNRHPLARRISASHVHGIGYVALPFANEAAAAPLPATPVPVAGEVTAAAGTEGGTLRERAVARARQSEPAVAPVTETPAEPPPSAGLKPDFSENFIDGLSPRQVARFAARHGLVRPRAPADGPARQVRADGRHAGRAPVTVYLLTAVIETGTRKSRVLLGTGAQAPVLGRRIHSAPRGTAVAAALLGAAGGLAWLLQPPAEPGSTPPVQATAVSAPATSASSAVPAETAASAATAAEATASAPVAAVAEMAAPSPAAHETTADSAAESAAAASAAAAAEAAPAASAPAAAQPGARPVAAPTAMARPASAPRTTIARLNDVAPHLGRLNMASIRPQLSEEARAAARQAHEGATAAPAPVARPASASTPAQSRVAAAAAAAAAATHAETAPASAPVAAPAVAPSASEARQSPSTFALSTRALRTRAEADQVRVAMVSLLRPGAAEDFKVEVLPQGDDWRVVGWPFPRRADADKARALLVSRGMRVEVIGF